jgi:succinoglycan biosynthesis transport protein ExoP
MSSTPNQRVHPGLQRPNQSSDNRGSAPSFDPVKLLQKYKFILLFAIFAGGVIGVASHFFFLKFFPQFRSTVIFECSPVQTDISVRNVEEIDEDEMARFIGTQVESLKGERVRGQVLEDPRLAAEAPEWYSKYERRGRFDVVEAYEDIEKIIRARAIQNSYLVELSVSVGKKEDAAGLVRLVKENYLRILNQDNSSGTTQQREQLREAITNAETRVTELMNRRNRFLQEMNMNTADTQQSAEAEMLRLINAQILGLQQQIEAYEIVLKNDESQLQKDTSIVYDSTLRQQVEQYPQILNLKQRVIDFESTLISLELDGIGRDHRSYKQAEQTLDATKRQLEITREELLLEAFESRINATRMALSQFGAQTEDLLRQREGLTTRLNELAQMSEEIGEISRQIENTLTLKAERESDLAKLNVTVGLVNANRIKVVKVENVPDKPSFPVIFVMVPAGVFLTTAFVAGVLVIFEILDQRVKSPADIALIPRTPILGMIPDAEEDPVKHPSLETLFSDSPNSVLAEQFRQLRTRITKKMLAHDHKTLLVVGAMPGSGATSVTTNLAQAMHASGKKVLLVDTNFRRARLHSAFGLAETPGLAEVLAGEESLSDTIQTTSTGVSVLPAGARNKRVVERLGTDMMGQILAQAATEFDLIIIDVAPAIVAGDAQTLATQVDSTMLVARAMQEKRGQIARLKNELSDTRAEFLGVLVNGVKSSAGGYMRKNIRTSHKYHAEESPQAV